MRKMISVLSFGAVTALAGFVIWARIRARKPKKADKREKGEIIKQLVALSDSENAVSAKISRASSRPASVSASRSDTKFRSKRKHRHVSPSPPLSHRPNETAAEMEEKIRQRAYELYLERGGMGGNPTDDWLQAKREVLSQKS
jgi:hypothetical protein